MINNEEIIFGEDFIQILDVDNEEIAYWTKEEWIEEPEIVFSICNAIKLASKNKLKEFLDKKETVIN